MTTTTKAQQTTASKLRYTAEQQADRYAVVHDPSGRIVAEVNYAHVDDSGDWRISSGAALQMAQDIAGALNYAYGNSA